METRSIIIVFLILGSTCLAMWYIAAWSFYDIQFDQQEKFATDGCTLVPQKFESDDARTCCEAHDRAYWQGGAEALRIRADQELRTCLERSIVANDVIAQYTPVIAHGVVHVFASPYVDVPWRWGFGWNFGRGYRSLTE